MPPPEPRRPSPWRQVGIVLGMVFTLPAAVALGGLLGWWLDATFGTSPLLTLLLLGLGFLGGLREIFRELKRLNQL